MEKNSFRINRLMLLSFLALSLLVLISLIFSGSLKADDEQELHEYSLAFNNQERTYYVYAPETKENTSYPVVINFHGGGGNALNEIRFTQMNQIADKYNFIAVYPDGTPSIIKDEIRTWNSGGNCCGKAYKDNSDDVGFTREIIKDLSKRYNIDKNRIYATGMSNGAMMSYRLACELSDQIAAIAPVAGTLNISNCNPSRPVPVMHFHGLNDKFCLFNGGQSKNSRIKVPFKSVPYSIETWKKIDGCPEKGKVYLKKGNVTCTSYSPCKNNSEVMLCQIKKGGHTWPGGKKTLKIPLGEVNTDINASEEMWKFFKNHPMPQN